ncbi:MAG: LolA family protein [Nitrospiraceae bacterium]
MKNPVRRSIVGVSIAALMLISFGCALLGPTEDASLKRATAEELTSLLRQREASLHSMKGLFSAKLRGGILPITSRVEGVVYYRRPNAMRLKGFASIGMVELFEFVQLDDLYTLRLPMEGKVFTGRQSDLSDKGKLARLSQLSAWAIGGVLGKGSIAKDERVKLFEEGDRYRLEVYAVAADGSNQKRTPLRRLWFDRRTLLVVQEDRLAPSGEVDATIQYEDFRLLDNPGSQSPSAKVATADQLLRPFKILLEDGQGRGSVQVTFHEILPNQAVKAEDLGQVS